MTVSNSVRTATIIGNGTTGPFQFVIYFLENSDITVTKTNVSGFTATLNEVTDYTLTGAGSATGGIITTTVALQPGETLTIARVLPLLQGVDLSNQGSVFPETLETALDRLTMIAQQQQTAISNTMGPQGPQGFTGPQGAGAQGATGAQGPSGPVGSQGAQGFSGPQGYQGNAGTQGPQGNQGNQGYQGATGNQGNQGPQGVQGYQGTQGNQGFQGYQGAQGINGSQGGAGTQGPQGAQGYQGYQGALGNQGYQGNSGVQGPPGTGLTKIGVPWTSGQNWVVGDAPSYNGNVYCCIVAISNSTTNPASDTTHFVLLGAQGTQGTPGAQGAAGLQGNVGSQGATGPQGNQGYQGSQGAAGVQGLTGPQGVTGPQGNIGSQGATGPQGSQGNQGYTGSQGVIGPQGAQGATGPQGVIGPQGLSGSQGPLGSQGYAGSQGPAGVQGSAGAQGPQGTIGPEFTTEQYAESLVVGTPASINLGNVNAGDRILVSAIMNIQGGSSANVSGTIYGGGTATITFCGPYSATNELQAPSVPAATGLSNHCITGIVFVTASGTLTLNASLQYSGSPGAYSAYIYSVFYKGP